MGFCERSIHVRRVTIGQWSGIEGRLRMAGAQACAHDECNRGMTGLLNKIFDIQMKNPTMAARTRERCNISGNRGGPFLASLVAFNGAQPPQKIAGLLFSFTMEFGLHWGTGVWRCQATSAAYTRRSAK